MEYTFLIILVSPKLGSQQIFFSRKPDSKYFRLYSPGGLSHNYSVICFHVEASRIKCKQMSLFCSSKTVYRTDTRLDFVHGQECRSLT